MDTEEFRERLKEQKASVIKQNRPTSSAETDFDYRSITEKTEKTEIIVME